MKFRIFISSVQDEFAAERRRLKEWLVSDPVFARFVESVFLFEDTPARGKSPANRYLEEVAKSHIYIGLLGRQYYGRRSSQSGVSATELEYDRAKECGLECFIYLKDVDGRDAEESAFVRKVSRGVTRVTFSGYDELRDAVYASFVNFLDERHLIATGDYDKSLCVEANLNDIDRARIDWFIDEANAKSKRKPYRHAISTRDFLKQFKLTRSGKLTNGALLLFGKEPQEFYAPCCLKCVWCEGTRYARPFLDSQVMRGNIFALIDQGTEFVLSRLARSRGLRTDGLVVPVKFDLPRESIEEAITNAVVHRDYHSHGSAEVRLFSDRLEIWNPGRLQDGVTIRELYETHSSYPVNWVLSDMVSRTGVMDSSGTGIGRMIDACRAVGLPDPSFGQSGPSFMVTFWMDNWTEPKLTSLGLADRQKIAVRALKSRRGLAASDYMALTGVSRNTATRDLQELVRLGVLSVSGDAKGTSYALNPVCTIYAPYAPSQSDCTKKGGGSAAVRAKMGPKEDMDEAIAANPNRQVVGLDVGLESRALNEVRTDPQIKMSEIAVKYHVSKRTVERMFGKLSQDGRIVRVGGKRFGHWEVIG